MSIVVSPFARTAAIRMFSVAPTDGKASRIALPCRASASATTQPCSMVLCAPQQSEPRLVHVEGA